MRSVFIWVFIALEVVVPALLMLVGSSDAVYVNERLDSIADELRAFVLLTLSGLLFLMSRERKESSLRSLAWGFLVMGVLRAVDSMTEFSHSAFWLKGLESLAVGVVFTVGWEKTSFVSSPVARKAISTAALSLISVFSVVAYFAPQLLPPLVIEGRFTLLGDVLSAIGACLTLAAVGRGLWRGTGQHSVDELVFINLCLSYGLFHSFVLFTHPWQIRWWILKAGLSFPFMIALVYVFAVFRRMQDEIYETTRKLRQSNDELESFAYIASHDLQEPVRMVSMYLGLLSRRYAERLDGEAREFIGFAVDGAGGMKKLISDLLDFSRLGRSPVLTEPVDLADALERALQNLSAAVDESGAQVTHDSLPTVNGAGTHFDQLFQNLVGNAIKFRGAEQPRVHIASIPGKSRGELELLVRDNGMGFEMKDSNRIFQPFHRLHGRAEIPGSGIGLATCKKIVERYGGRIWAESAPGKGTTFHFTLKPVSRPEGQAEKPGGIMVRAQP